MENEIPEPIQKLIQIGREKVAVFERQNELEWNDAVARIEEDWRKIEALIKTYLPVEVREYFSISMTEKFQKIDDSNRSSYTLIPEDLATLKTNFPEITAVGKKGLLKIPGLHDIMVTFSGEGDMPIVIYHAEENYRNKVEQDGSLEMALYYASLSTENKPNSEAFLPDEDEIPDA